MRIRKVEGGYIITDDKNMERIVTSIEDLLEWIMLHFEGKSKHFYENLYARITVSYKRPPEDRS